MCFIEIQNQLQSNTKWIAMTQTNNRFKLGHIWSLAYGASLDMVVLPLTPHIDPKSMHLTFSSCVIALICCSRFLFADVSTSPLGFNDKHIRCGSSDKTISAIQHHAQYFATKGLMYWNYYSHLRAFWNTNLGNIYPYPVVHLHRLLDRG